MFCSAWRCRRGSHCHPRTNLTGSRQCRRRRLATGTGSCVTFADTIDTSSWNSGCTLRLAPKLDLPAIAASLTHMGGLPGSVQWACRSLEVPAGRGPAPGHGRPVTSDCARASDQGTGRGTAMPALPQAWRSWGSPESGTGAHHRPTVIPGRPDGR